MSELTVPQIDFSSLGQLPEIYRQGQANALRQQTLASLGQGGQADAAALLRSGDLSLAQLGVNLRNHEDTLKQQERDFTFRQAEAARAQKNSDRSYALQTDPTPDNFVADKTAPGGYRPIGPATPEYKASVAVAQAKAEADAAVGKPIPFETIGGTRFLVKGPDGYAVLDPATVGKQPGPVQQPAPAQPGQPVPQVQPASPPASAETDAIDEKTGRREAYLQTLDPQIRDYIKKVADYEIDPRTTSVKGGMREKLLSAVAKYDPTYNQNDFTARSKAIKDFSTGTQGNIIRSFDVAIDHLDTLQRAADAMKNGDVRIINQIRSEWRRQTGSDLPSNFQALVPLVSGEIAKAVIGSNNALSDREELRHNLQVANSPDQIAGVISGYKGLMSGQLKGLRKQYEQTTGKKDFNSRLREHTLKELDTSDKAAPVTIDGYTIKEN
jgi:hypothetical protein